MNAPVEKSLLRWLGLRHDTTAAEPGHAGGGADGRSVAGPAEPCSVEQAARRDLLSAIGAFLLDNDLAVTDANLNAARAAFSGMNRALGRTIASRRQEGEPITQEWLDEVLASDGDSATTKEEYEQLVTRLQSGLDVFTAVTKSARSAQGEYRTVLEQQVGRMDAVDYTGMALNSLADITQVMLERTRHVENEIRRSESEACALRKSLERAQHDAEIDHLTGLPNRRAFEGVLQREYREAQAAIEPLCVAFCDIDHFKRVNDMHGHETGDRVIQAIAQVLARISNKRCHVSRHGGEEFVVLFRDMTRADAKIRLDEARTQLEARNFLNRKTDEPIGGITFSAGIADVFGYPDYRAALEAADQALFRAKQEGRNRILIA